jgi:hypothetical protein
MDSKKIFITLSVIRENSTSPVTVNTSYIIKFEPDGEDVNREPRTRVYLSKHSFLVEGSYETIYQQITGKVFLG